MLLHKNSLRIWGIGTGQSELPSAKNNPIVYAWGPQKEVKC